MKTLFIEARAEDVKIPSSIISRLPEKVILATTVQFVGSIENIQSGIESSGRQVLLYQGKRSKHPGQVLGCDIEKIEGDADAILYIGTGLFHPKMLVLKNEIPVFSYDPMGEKFDRIDTADMNIMMRRKKGIHLKFMAANEVGILLSVKHGQYYANAKEQLKEKYPDKAFTSFLSDTIDFTQLDNFPFIGVWVNTSCPRIGYDDSHAQSKPIINIQDVLE